MDARIAERPPGRGMVAPPPPASAAAVSAARPEVFQLLMRTPAFLGLPEDERRRIAGDTVRVLSYMADPGGVHSEIAAREASGELPGAPTAQALADDPLTATRRQLS